MIGEIDHEVLSEGLVAVEPEKEEGHGDEDRGETPQSSSSRLAKICRLRKMIVHHPLQEVEKKGKEKKERKKKKGNLLSTGRGDDDPLLGLCTSGRGDLGLQTSSGWGDWLGNNSKISII